MDELNLTTETIQVGDKPAAVVALAGCLDTYTAPKFMVALDGLIDEGMVDIIVDMAELEYMSSAGFGVLAGADRHLAEHNGKLVIAGLSEKLKHIFDDLGLPAIVRTVAGREAAIKALR